MSVLGIARRRWLCRVGIAGTSAAIGLVATGAVLSPASADAPVKVGWWNFAAAGGQAAPAPDTNAGGIRVSVTSQQVLSFGAVQYNLPRDASATLELAITHMSGNSSVGSFNDIEACPTKGNSWKAGDDQDASGAPGYDCDVHRYVGRLSADGATMTFLVDGSADVSDGVLSLAIVPVHTTAIPAAGTDPGTGADMTPPFVVDFDKPSASSFTADGSSSSSASGSSLGGSSSAPPPASGGIGSTGGATSVPAAPAPPSGGDVNVPPVTSDSPGQTPVVAGQQQPAATGAAAPAAAITPLKTNDSKRFMLLVLLVLLLFGILYTQMASQRAPRALAAAHSQPGEDVAALPVPYPPGVGVARGLGRFAKPRTTGARPLI